MGAFGHDGQGIFAEIMRLTPPKTLIFVIAAAAILLGILMDPEIGLITGYEDLSFWILAGGGVLMSLGVMFKGL